MRIHFAVKNYNLTTNYTLPIDKINCGIPLNLPKWKQIHVKHDISFFLYY